MKAFLPKKLSFDTVFLLLSSGFFVLLRFPSLFEPYWYGDESIYQVIGTALNHGRLLYQGIWDNKPPLLYLVYALFHADQPTIRLASLIAGMISLWIFYFLAKRLFSHRKTYITATILFTVLLGLPFLEGNIANAENFMIPFIIGAAWIIVTLMQTNTLREHKLTEAALLGSAGLLLGTAFLFKIVGIFDFAAFFVFIFICDYHSNKKLPKQLFSLTLLTLGFITPFLISVIYFAQQHILGVYLTSAFKNNIGYVNYGNQFIIPQGLLVLKTLLVAGCCLFFFMRRKHFKQATLFISIWLVFSVFNALFSQRPYTHYLLVVIASFSLFFAYTFCTKRLRFETSFLAIILCLFLSINFWYYLKIVPYYANFALFITNHRSLTQYQAFFDGNIPQDYQLVEFLTSTQEASKTFYVWGNDAQIYTLTHTLPPGRFIVAYHVIASSAQIETAHAVQKENPDLIIVLPGQPPLPFSVKDYQKKRMIGSILMYEKLF